MSKMTPMQQVEKTFGTRGDLVDAIVQLTGDGSDGRSSLMGTTNKKLLRIHTVAQTVSDGYGGKSGLIDAISSLQFSSGKPNAGWREKMEGKTVKFLFDHHRQLTTRQG